MKRSGVKMQKKPTQIGDVIFVNNDNSKPCQYINIAQEKETKKFTKIINAINYTLQRSNHFFKDLLNINNKEQYCHVAICIFPNIFIEVAGLGGVSCRSFEAIIQNSKYLLYRNQDFKINEVDFIEENLDHIGKPYVPNFSKDNKDNVAEAGFFCSEYVILLLKKYNLIHIGNDKASPMDILSAMKCHKNWNQVDITKIEVKVHYTKNIYFENLASYIKIKDILSSSNALNISSTHSIRPLTFGFRFPKTIPALFSTLFYNLSSIHKVSCLTPNIHSIAQQNSLLNYIQQKIKNKIIYFEGIVCRYNSELGNKTELWNSIVNDIEQYSAAKYIKNSSLTDTHEQLVELWLLHNTLEQYAETLKENCKLDKEQIVYLDVYVEKELVSIGKMIISLEKNRFKSLKQSFDLTIPTDEEQKYRFKYKLILYILQTNLYTTNLLEIEYNELSSNLQKLYKPKKE